MLGNDFLNITQKARNGLKVNQLDVTENFKTFALSKARLWKLHGKPQELSFKGQKEAKWRSNRVLTNSQCIQLTAPHSTLQMLTGQQHLLLTSFEKTSHSLSENIFKISNKRPAPALYKELLGCNKETINSIKNWAKDSRHIINKGIRLTYKNRN